MQFDRYESRGCTAFKKESLNVPQYDLRAYPSKACIEGCTNRNVTEFP